MHFLRFRGSIHLNSAQPLSRVTSTLAEAPIICCHRCLCCDQVATTRLPPKIPVSQPGQFDDASEDNSIIFPALSSAPPQVSQDRKTAGRFSFSNDHESNNDPECVPRVPPTQPPTMRQQHQHTTTVSKPSPMFYHEGFQQRFSHKRDGSPLESQRTKDRPGAQSQRTMLTGSSSLTLREDQNILYVRPGGLEGDHSYSSEQSLVSSTFPPPTNCRHFDNDVNDAAVGLISIDPRPPSSKNVLLAFQQPQRYHHYRQQQQQQQQQASHSRATKHEHSASSRNTTTMKHEFEMPRKERAQQFHARATFALANHKNIAAPTEQILNEDHGTEETPNIRPKKVLSKSVLRSLKHPNSLLLPGSDCGLHEHPHTLPDCETKNHPIGADQLTDFDVLLGRGGHNSHPGNLWFRELLQNYRLAYKTVPKCEKKRLSANLCNYVRQCSGRFLLNIEGLWYEVGDDRAHTKCGQRLREGTAAVVRQTLQRTLNENCVLEKIHANEEEENNAG